MKELHKVEMHQGAAWLNSRYQYTILQGKLNPKKWYYASFEDLYYPKADVILTIDPDGKRDIQYLYGIER